MQMKIIRAALQPTLHDLSLCRRPCLPLPPPNRPPRALSSVELKTPRPSPGPHIPSSPASRASPPLHPSTTLTKRPANPVSLTRTRTPHPSHTPRTQPTHPFPSYAYWKANLHEKPCVFDLFFRKNPFKGEFTIFAGLEECLKYVKNYRFSASDIQYLREMGPLADAEPGFFTWLENLDTSAVSLYAVPEGSVVFPRTPLIRLEGPLGICQLLETTLLNLTNYASLITTNAARFRLAAGEDKTLLEFGLRRAQGPDGAMSASRCVLGSAAARRELCASCARVVQMLCRCCADCLHSCVVRRSRV